MNDNTNRKQQLLPVALGVLALVVVVVVALVLASNNGGSGKQEVTDTPKGSFGVNIDKSEGLDTEFSIFATLASKPVPVRETCAKVKQGVQCKKGKIIGYTSKILWTKRVYADKPFVVKSLPKDAQVIALTASPCKGKGDKKADCNVFNGGQSLGSWDLTQGKKGAKPPKGLSIVAKCKLTKDKAGINCDGTKVDFK